MSKEDLIQLYIKKHRLHSLFSQNKMPDFDLIVFEKDEILLRENYISNYLYFIVKGSVKIFTYSSQGKVVYIHKYIDSFQLLGETASLWGFTPVANVQAQTKVTCLRLSLSDYQKQLFNDPVFLRYVGKLLANRIQNSNMFLLSMMHTNLPERLANFILDNAHDQLFSLSLTETADFLGTSYRHLLRCLNAFYEAKLLKREGRKIRIIDNQQLLAVAKDIKL